MPFDGTLQITASTVLLRAADILERDGWGQHDMHRNGQHCMLGAIQLAALELCEMNNLPRSKIYPTISNIYVNLDRIIGKNVVVWNDRWWRTQRQVIGKLRKVAEVIA